MHHMYFIYIFQSDPSCEILLYNRTKEQQLQLGLAFDDSNPNEEDGIAIKEEKVKFDSSSTNDDKEVMEFETVCSACGGKGKNKMCVTDIPNFKEIIIMSFQCDECGYKCNEIKSGGAISEKGQIITLKVKKENAENDLKRDFIKSDSAEICIPELDFEMEKGSMGGMYTSVEGVLKAMYDRVKMGLQYYFNGDSNVEERKVGILNFLEELNKCSNGERDFTLVVKDPLASCWIMNLVTPDPFLNIEYYERTNEENEDLGINEIKTDNYDNNMDTIQEEEEIENKEE